MAKIGIISQNHPATTAPIRDVNNNINNNREHLQALGCFAKALDLHFVGCIKEIKCKVPEEEKVCESIEW